MKHYIDSQTNTIYAYESDGSQDSSIPPHLQPLSDNELATLRASTFDDMVAQFDAAIEAHIHAGAQSRGYTNIERACMYASFPNPYWEESKSYVEWVGNVWAYCYQELEKIVNGDRTIPAIGDFVLELPARNLPSV